MKFRRVQRLVRLLGLLQSGRGHNAPTLAAACGVSRRSIFRDLDVLKQAGVPLVYDEARQHYRIPGAYYLPPTQFTADEALAVIALCHDADRNGQAPFWSSARNAAVKLEHALPHRLRDRLREVLPAVRVQLEAGNPLDGQQPAYEAVVTALAERRCLRVRYRSFLEGQAIGTKLSPYQLLYHRRSWYVIGRSSLHRSVRTFNLGRFESWELLPDHYERPRGFSLDRYLGNAWQLIPEPGPDHAVAIRFRPKVAGNVAEVQWHKTQELEPQPDGSLLFRARVSGVEEISWWVLGYGDQAEVLAPAALRELVARRAAAMAALYARPEEP